MKSQNLSAIVSLLLSAGLVLAGCQLLEEEKNPKKDGDIPSGLATDCDTVTDGGALNVNTSGRSATIQARECVTYNFIADADLTYRVTLTNSAGNADLIVAFDAEYTSQVLGSPSTKGSTIADVITISSPGSSRSVYIAIYASLESSTYSITVETGGGAAVPTGLATDCDSVTDGGELDTIGGVENGTIQPRECITYNFIAQADITHTVTLTNTAGNADLIVAFDEEYTIPVAGSPSANGSTESDVLSAGSTSEQRFYIAVYATLETSTFAIKVEIGDGTDGDGTGDGGVTDMPDLTIDIDDVQYIGDGVADHTVQVDYTIHNVGLAATDETCFDVDFFPNPDTTPTPGNPGVASASHCPVLTPDGLSSELSDSVNIDAGQISGKIWAVVDSSELIAESNEGNNVAEPIDYAGSVTFYFETVENSACNASPDTHLEIYDLDLNFIVKNEDIFFPTNLLSQIQLDLTSGDSVLIVVWDFSGDQLDRTGTDGDYSFRVSSSGFSGVPTSNQVGCGGDSFDPDDDLSTGAVPVSVDTWATRYLEYQGADWFSFTAP